MKSLELNGKQVNFPFFMPVATKLSTKLVSLREVENLGFKTIIANSFLLYLYPGPTVVKQNGGLRKFTNTNLNFFTDSGGFQLLYDDFFVKISQKGIKFKSPYDKSLHMITPEKCMRIQERLGSDGVMCLDYMPRYKDSKEAIIKSVELTTDWAKRCKESYKGKGKLFCIIQGGIHPELRKQSAESLVDLDFDGYAIGGLGIGESREEMRDVVKKTLKFLPKEKPIYLMGIGHPEEVKEFVKMGVDMFDSTYPTQVARHSRVFLKDGHLDLNKERFIRDFKKIDENCECYTCQNHSRAYLHHLIKIREPLVKRLLTIHNLYYMKNLFP